MTPIIRDLVMRADDLLTVREAARALGLSVGRVRVFLREGRLKFERQGRLIFIHRGDVEAGVPRKPRSGGRKAKARPPKRRYVKRSEHWCDGRAQAQAMWARDAKRHKNDF